MRHVAESRFEERPRIQAFDLGRPAGFVNELLRSIALQEQKTAGFERAFEIFEKCGPLGGTDELCEDHRYNVEGVCRPAPTGDVGQFRAQPHAALRRKLARFLQCRRRKVDGEHVKTLLGEPDAVAAFAVGDRQRRAAATQPVRLGFEKSIRLLAERVAGRAKPRLPPFQFRHCQFLMLPWPVVLASHRRMR